MSEFRELVLGGSRLRLTNKRACLDADTKFKNPTYLDINPDEGVDVVWDLNNHPLPFEDNTFDEVYAYDVLEHLSTQGNYKFFFEEFNEYHRIIKPEGTMHILVPEVNKPWAFGDPGHTRVLPPEVFWFLNPDQYKSNLLQNTPSSNYSSLINGGWKLVTTRSTGVLMYIKLKAI